MTRSTVIRTCQMFKALDGRVFTVTGPGARSSYALSFDGAPAGSMARDRLLRNINDKTFVTCGFQPQHTVRRVFSVLGA